MLLSQKSLPYVEALLVCRVYCNSFATYITCQYWKRMLGNNALSSCNCSGYFIKFISSMLE
jgi:hypothetical protein